MALGRAGGSSSLSKEWELCHDLPLISSNGAAPSSEVVSPCARCEEGTAALRREARGCGQCLGCYSKSSYASSPAPGRRGGCRWVTLLALPGRIFCCGGGAGELVPRGKSPGCVQLDCIF